MPSFGNFDYYPYPRQNFVRFYPSDNRPGEFRLDFPLTQKDFSISGRVSLLWLRNAGLAVEKAWPGIHGNKMIANFIQPLRDSFPYNANEWLDASNPQQTITISRDDYPFVAELLRSKGIDFHA